MTNWTNEKATAVVEGGGLRLRLLVEQWGVTSELTFYWQVMDEFSFVQASGSRSSFGQAKSSASRAAKALIKGTRPLKVERPRCRE